jgi:hypothetical protein
MYRVWQIIKRILATFALNALAVIGGGALIGLDVVQTILLAGILGVANVLEDLARGYVNDGYLSDEEIESAFRRASESDI